MKKNNKGFTLVELLAVIVIMGILMMAAIPAITRAIENSRKDTFVDIAKSYVNSVRTLWTSDNIMCGAASTYSSALDDGDYYILINSKESAKDSLPVLLDQGGKSSWGNRDMNGYVRVNISTTPGEDTDGDGEFDVEPKRLTKFYVSLSDGTHGILDNDTLTMDELVRGNVNMTLSDDDLKKIELTVDDGRLDCGKSSSGKYSCAEVKPIKKITGVCVDDQTNVGLTGRVAVPESFEKDDWDTIIDAINSGTHPYSVGDTKEVYMGEEFGTHTVRLANLSTPSECSTPGFSQTACGTVIEFSDVITTYVMNDTSTNIGGWPASKLRTYLNNEIYNVLPKELRNVIISTMAVSGHGKNVGEINFITTDKIYLLSTAEIWEQGESNLIVNDTARESTRQLDYYQGVTTNSFARVMKRFNNWSGWWLRTPDFAYNTSFYLAMGNGSCGVYGAVANPGISPAFRIG